MHHNQEFKKHDCWRGKFPTFSFILLLVGIFWLLNEIGVIAINIPWLPIILIGFAISGMLSYRK